MVRVEWVTDQVRWRKVSAGGDDSEVGEMEAGVVVYLEGRRIMGGMVGLWVGGWIIVLIVTCDL